ncbi:MAG: DUF1573 domain-containing protein [Bacteroidia bacterium]|nr:DUF1573 domain-containing protein [Bacteroidia bacterium]
MYRKLVLITAISVLVASCANDNQEQGVSTNDITNSASANGEDKGSLPEIKFEEEEHDFGRITQGEKVSYAFKFKNIGKGNLIIASAAGSCGCTVPEFPKEPVLPGQEGKINVVFNSEGKSGIQEKTITVVTNCEPSTRVIRIKTDVIVAEAVKDEGF